MSRYIFTPEGAKNLKNSINQTVNALNSFYWLSYHTTHAMRSITSGIHNYMGEAEASEIIAKVERYKPAHAKLLNDISNIFGYNTYKELKTVAESSTHASEHVVVGESDYNIELYELFKGSMQGHFKLNENTSISINAFVLLLVNAWELNKDLVPFRDSQVSITGANLNQCVKVTITNSGGQWSVRDENDDLIECINDETYKGALLPAIGRFVASEELDSEEIFHVENLAFAMSDQDNLINDKSNALYISAFFNVHDINSIDDKAISGNYSISKNAQSKVFLEKLTREQYLELAGSNRNTYAEFLLAHISAMMVFTKNADAVDFFTKPKTAEDFVKLLTGKA